MNTLVKVAAHDCPVCANLSPMDGDIAEEKGFYFRRIELSELARNPSHIRDYIVPMYVTPNDGNIDLPIYLILEEERITASRVIQTVEELINLFHSWETYKKSKS